jgi:hypothetical protein
VFVLAGEALGTQGKIEEALEMTRRAVTADPADVRTLEHATAYARAHYNIGSALAGPAAGRGAVPRRR